MKGGITFVSGLVLGGAAVYVVGLTRVKPAPAPATGAAPEAAVAAAQAEIAELRLKLEAARAEAARVPEPEPAPAPVAEPEPEPELTENARRFRDMIRQVGESQLKSQLQASLARLRERLQLTPEQEEKMRQLSEKTVADMMAALNRLLDGKGEPGDFATIARFQFGTLPLDYAAVLEPEQQAEFARFQQEERANRIEMRANAELLALQASGGLSGEQKDQAFSRFSEFAAAEEDTDWSRIQTREQVGEFFEGAIQRRLEAMDDVLTEPQMKIYQQQIDLQRQAIGQMIPGLEIAPER